MTVSSLRWSVLAGLSGLAVLACSGSDAGGNQPGSTGGVPLVSCDLKKESSANPTTQPCGDLTTPLGAAIKLGQYGAVMEPNVGKGFENTVAASDQPGSTQCQTFAASFQEDPTLTAQLLDTGNIDFSIYTVYRPANWPADKIPILSWGNGTCAQPEGYGSLLRYIASQGFFIVAANSRQVGTGAEIKHGLDFAFAANEDPKSPYYHHLDTTKVGVMGHSQGSAGANAAAADSRVGAVILFNAGLSNAKPFMAVSGDLDITHYTSDQMAQSVAGAQQGAYLFFHNPAGMGPLKGHLVLMMTPERLTNAAAGFWQLVFNGDADAKNLFVGSSCGLCNQTDQFNFGEKGF